MKFTLLSSETVFTGRAFQVQKQDVRLPDGRLTNYDVIDHPGAVTLLPLDGDGHILFVRQFRVAVRRDVLELPAGTLEPGEDPDVCAAREVREETGMAAGNLIKLGDFYLAPGYSSEHMHVYLATSLYPAPLSADSDEFLQVEKIPVAQAYSMAEDGQFKDGKTLACLTLARPHLEKFLVD